MQDEPKPQPSTPTPQQKPEPPRPTPPPASTTPEPPRPEPSSRPNPPMRPKTPSPLQRPTAPPPIPPRPTSPTPPPRPPQQPSQAPQRPPQPPKPQAPRPSVPSEPPKSSPPDRPQHSPYQPSQRKAYLERGEVHSMQKDINKLRDEQAKAEQIRISQLKTQHEAEREQEAVQKIRAAAQQAKQQEETQRKEQLRKIQNSILPPGEEVRVQQLRRPSKGKKVFVRILFIAVFAFIALNLALFAAWFFFFRSDSPSFSFQFPEIPFINPGQQTPTPSPQPQPQPTPQPEPQPTPQPCPQPQPTGFQNIIVPDHTSIVQFSTQADLITVLRKTIQQEQQDSLVQIIPQNKTNSTQITEASTFLTFAGATLSEPISSLLSNEAFFFSYSYERGNRFGLVARVTDAQAAAQTLQQWEPRAEQSLASLAPFWGSPGTGYTTSFRSSAHQGVEIRFQTFSTQDYGIVYAFVDNYLIIASSFEATKALIETLQASISALPEQKTLATIDESVLFKPPDKLSFEDSIGQTLMIGFEGSTVTPDLEELMKRLQPGGVLLLSKNIESVDQLKQLSSDLQGISLEYSSLPLIIAVDQEGGAISRIDFGKEKTAQSTIEDEDHAYNIGRQRAEELKYLGVNLNLSPVLDSTNPEDFLFDRTFQAGRFEAGMLAQALLNGQHEGGILSTLKHFPGYGNITFNPERKLATVQEFPDISPFVFALTAKPEFLLLSNVIYSNFEPDMPFSFSKKGISMIRSDLNFNGIVITDDLNQPSLLNNYSLKDIGIKPLKAGVNMIMFSEQTYAQDMHQILLDASENDPILKKSIEDSAANILELKKEFIRSTESEQHEKRLSQNR